MAFAKINWRPNSSDLRKFGLTLFVATGIVGSIFYFGFDKETFPYCLWGFGSFALLTSLFGRPLGLPAYYLWMGFVFTVSTLIGYTSLVLIYYLVVFPIGLLAKLFGRDRLALKPSNQDSYWIPVAQSTDSSNFDKQY